MASISKIKGRYFFGVDAATSVVPQAGSGNLTYTAGTGGATWYSNYVDLGQGSRFSTPFNSLSRNRTIIMAGVLPHRESAYDTGDATTKWPITVARTGAMDKADYLLSWASGFYGFGVAGSNLITAPGGGGTTPAWATSEKFNTMLCYRDGTFNWRPGLLVLGQGASGTGLYLGQTVGHNMAWSRDTTAYTGNRGVLEPSVFGHVNGSGGAGAGTLVHAPLLAYAEYEWLTEAEVLEACDEMVTLLEARGWLNTFERPTRINIPLVATGSGEGALPPLASPPAITAVNANFTVAASPVSGWTRITKVGGTNGTYEQAATSGLLPATWGVYIKDPSETAGWTAGVSKQAGPYGEAGICGWKPNGAGNGTILRWEGAYIGSNRARIVGGSYGMSRMCDGRTGTVCRFTGDKQTGFDTSTASYGTTDAAFPMIFDCSLSGIGHYIDVRIV